MREQSHRLIRPHPALVAGVFLLAACVLWPAGPRAQTPAATLYEQAQAAEQTARADSPTSPDSLRKVAKTYENLVLRYPTSGYADNALWQAAGLFTTAFQTSADGADRQQAERLLKWLKQEYPSSPFVKRVDGALQALGQAPAGAAAASSAPPPASRVEHAAGVAARANDAAGLGASGRGERHHGQTALPHGERITIEFSKEVAFTGDRVENPDRVFFDFANATAPASLPRSRADAERDARQGAAHRAASEQRDARRPRARRQPAVQRVSRCTTRSVSSSTSRARTRARPRRRPRPRPQARPLPRLRRRLVVAPSALRWRCQRSRRTPALRRRLRPRDPAGACTHWRHAGGGNARAAVEQPQRRLLALAPAGPRRLAHRHRRRARRPRSRRAGQRHRRVRAHARRRAAAAEAARRAAGIRRRPDAKHGRLHSRSRSARRSPTARARISSSRSTPTRAGRCRPAASRRTS